MERTFVVPKSVMKNNNNQVNGLFPIIRRVRRPLLPADVTVSGQLADAKPAAETTNGNPDENHESKPDEHGPKN